MKRLFIIIILLLGIVCQADAGFRIKPKPPKLPKKPSIGRVKPKPRPRPGGYKYPIYPPVYNVPDPPHDDITVTDVSSTDSIGSADSIDSQLALGQDQQSVDETNELSVFLWGLAAIILVIAAWYLYLMYKSGDLDRFQKY